MRHRLKYQRRCRKLFLQKRRTRTQKTHQRWTHPRVIPYYPPAKTKGGIYIPDATRDREAFATVAAYVVKVGPDAYKDQDKFPSGAWASEKSWVLMGRYAGNRFKVDGLEVRLINDDNIIATILDPSDISYV
jgi:co-chaperonin GroES (HSP10)